MLRRFVVALAAFALANAALADEAGGYIGGSLGASSAPARCEDDLVDPPRCEGNAAVLRGFLGYSFNRRFAVEVGALGFEGGSGGVDFSAVGSIPLDERVALYGRLGAFVVDNNYSNVTYGGGLRFAVGERSALRVEWQHFEGGKGLDVLAIGIQSRF